MKNLSLVSAVFATAVAFSGLASAQSLDFSTTDDTTGLSYDFTIAGSDGGLSTASPYYTSNIQGTLSADMGSGAVPKIFSDYSGAGWVLSSALGTLVIAGNDTTLADPFVAYSTSFANTSGASGSFDVSYNSDFAPIDFSGALERAEFGLTVSDGTPNLSGVTVTASQTAQLVNTGTSAAVTLNPVALQNNYSSSTVNPTQPVTTANYPSYLLDPSVTGLYNELQVTVAGTYSAGAQIGVSGRVDVNDAPEPRSSFLLLLGGACVLGIRLRRFLVS